MDARLSRLDTVLQMLATERVDLVMSQPALSIDLEQSVGAALNLFTTRPCHHLPVMSGRRVIGMLTPSDLMTHDGFLPAKGAGAISVLQKSAKLAKLLHRPVVTIEAHASLADAARMMIAHAIHALPVVDEQTQLLGIITTTDIMYATLRVESSTNLAPSGAQSDGALAKHTETGVPPERSGDSGELRMSQAHFGEAVTAAKESLELGQDVQDIAQALLMSQRRCAVLERVLVSASRYLSAGQDPPLHSALTKVIAEAERLRPNGDIDRPVMLG